MLTYVKFSIFDSPAQTLVNTVNTVGVMGKGIALHFKHLYPDMFEQYRNLCLDGKLKTGMLHIYRTPNKIIVNLPTKKHWRQKSRIEYVESGLAKFVSGYTKYGISSVSFPQLGCGNGELNWEDQVKPLMEGYLQKLPIPVYIHLYSKAPDFVPERLDPEFAREMRVARERPSTDQVWNDLRKFSNPSGQRSLFEPQLAMDDEIIKIIPIYGDEILIHRADIDDIWNTLRIRGTITIEDLPSSLIVDGVTDTLFDLMSKLPYVLKVDDIRPARHKSTKGLRYSPQARKYHSDIVEIVA